MTSRALAFALFASTSALAQSAAPAPSAELEARAAFERGVALSRAERWGEALEDFRRSRALNARPSAAFNVASCLVRLGRAVEAVEAFDDYFRLATDPAQEGPRYAEAQQQLAATRATIATASFTVSPSDAVITIDGVEAPGTGAARSLRLDPRSHRVVVSAPRHEPFSATVAPRQGERLSLVASLRRITIATITVTATPATATLTVDGVAASLGRPLSLSEGRHGLRLAAPEHEPSERWVQLSSGETSTLHVDLPGARAPSALRSPWLWTGVGVAVAGIAATAIYFAIPAPLYGGTTNTVIQGLGR
jgi:hypothetical protein